MIKTLAGQALEKLIHEQPKLVQRKDSITLALVSIIWLASLVTTYEAALPVWVGVVSGGVASVAGVLLVAFTRGAITPSMVKRADDAAQKIANEYVGKHREDEKVMEASTNQTDYESEAVKHRRSGLGSGGIADHYLGR